jgi:hypothetical protein
MDASRRRLPSVTRTRTEDALRVYADEAGIGGDEAADTRVAGAWPVAKISMPELENTVDKSRAEKLAHAWRNRVRTDARWEPAKTAMWFFREPERTRRRGVIQRRLNLAAGGPPPRPTRADLTTVSESMPSRGTPPAVWLLKIPWVSPR